MTNGPSRLPAQNSAPIVAKSWLSAVSVAGKNVVSAREQTYLCADTILTSRKLCHHRRNKDHRPSCSLSTARDQNRSGSQIRRGLSVHMRPGQLTRRSDGRALQSISRRRLQRTSMRTYQLMDQLLCWATDALTHLEPMRFIVRRLSML